MAQETRGRLSRKNWILFPLLTLSTLRVSLTKEARREFLVLTQDPRTRQNFEQQVHADYDAELGHPNPRDQEVLLGLITMTRKQGEASLRELRFTQTELIDVLNWHRWSDRQRRIDKALHRWSAIKLTFEKGLFDEAAGAWQPTTLPVFSKLEVSEAGYLVEWSEPIFASIQSRQFHFSLRDYQKFNNPIARQIYLLTHQTLAERGSVEYPLTDFCAKVLRMHSGYSPGECKRKLSNGIKDLEENGYIVPGPRKERYPFQRDGLPTICFAAGPMFRNAKPAEAPKPPALTPRRRGRGVAQMELGLPSASASPATDEFFLFRATSPAAPSSKAPTLSAVKLAEHRAINTFWETLGPDRRQQEERVAFSRANEKQQKALQENDGSAEIVREKLLRKHALLLMIEEITE